MSFPQSVQIELDAVELSARRLRQTLPQANALAASERDGLERASAAAEQLAILTKEDLVDALDGAFILLAPPETEDDEVGHGIAQVSHRAFALQVALRRLRSACKAAGLSGANAGLVEPDASLIAQTPALELLGPSLEELTSGLRALQERLPKVASDNVVQAGMINVAGGIHLKIDLVAGLVQAVQVAINVVSHLLRSISNSARKLSSSSREVGDVQIAVVANSLEHCADDMASKADSLLAPSPASEDQAPPRTGATLSDPTLVAVARALCTAAKHRRTISYVSLSAAAKRATGAGFQVRWVGAVLNPISDALLELGAANGQQLPILTSIAVRNSGSPGEGLHRNIVSHTQRWKTTSEAIAFELRWRDEAERSALIGELQREVFSFDSWDVVANSLCGAPPAPVDSLPFN